MSCFLENIMPDNNNYARFYRNDILCICVSASVTMCITLEFGIFLIHNSVTFDIKQIARKFIFESFRKITKLVNFRYANHSTPTSENVGRKLTEILRLEIFETFGYNYSQVVPFSDKLRKILMFFHSRQVENTYPL